MKYSIIKPNSLKDFIEISEEFGSAKEHQRIPLARILSILGGTFNNQCKTIIIEEGDLDKEYRKEYELFYKHVFDSNSPKKSQRMHFFSKRIDKVDSISIKKCKNEYLGYCTLRPKPYSTISDAFISERTVIDVTTRFVFLPCSIEKRIRLKGIELKVKGFPFMQQDGRIVACAQAALQIIAHYYYEKREIKKFYTAPDITEIARKSPHQSGERHVPTSGLNVIQIRLALEEMGFNPKIYDYSFSKEEEVFFQHPEQVIYRHLESGIPVIVGIETKDSKHALVVIGHTFNPDYWWSQVETLYYNLPKTGFDYQCSTNWIQNFIVQDDNLGPYFFIPTQFLRTTFTNCIVVPLEKHVFLPGEDAEKFAYSAVTREEVLDIMASLAQYLQQKRPDSLTVYWLNLLLECINRKQLILRSYLKDRDTFLAQDIKDYNNEVQKIYKKLKLPNKVWVVEISVPSLFCYARQKCGEILMDPTGDIRFNPCYLSIHFPGGIIERNILTQKMLFHKIEKDDLPIRHLYRKL